MNIIKKKKKRKSELEGRETKKEEEMEPSHLPSWEFENIKNKIMQKKLN